MKAKLSFFSLFVYSCFCSATDIPKNWLKGAEEGDTASVHLIAHKYAHDYNHSAKALKWLNKSIEMRDTNIHRKNHNWLWSKTILAGYYWEGLGVKKDQEKAITLLKESAEKGYPYAAFALGYIYKNYMREDGQTIKWLYKAHILLTKHDYLSVSLDMLFSMHGWTFLTKKDRKERKKSLDLLRITPKTMLEEYAASNNKWACRYLGDICIRYSGGGSYDFKEGLLYYEKAALMGDEESKPFVSITTGHDGKTGYAEIGKVFYEGIGTTPQPERAIEYFKLGTKYHNYKSIDESNCFFYLGLSYYEGKGNEQDYENAWLNFIYATGWDEEKWPDTETALNDPEYKKSYHNTEAMRYLSRCYRFGRGCKKDLVKADEWLERASITDAELKDLYSDMKDKK